MNTIHKYQIRKVEDKVLIQTHRVVRWLDVQMQHDLITLWAVVDPDSEIEPREIYIRGTGHPMLGIEGRHLGSVQDRAFIWHLFLDFRDPAS